MVRPTIRRKNLFLSYLARARTLTRAWTKSYTGIEAVMLTGGVSRGYADEMSELDLTLFLRPATYRLWIERCQSPLPEGDNLIGSWAVDLYYASIARERNEVWSPLKIWDRSFAAYCTTPEVGSPPSCGKRCAPSWSHGPSTKTRSRRTGTGKWRSTGSIARM